MKIELKYPLILGILPALLLANAIPVLLLPEKAALTNFSVFPGAGEVEMSFPFLHNSAFRMSCWALLSAHPKFENTSTHIKEKQP